MSEGEYEIDQIYLSPDSGVVVLTADYGDECHVWIADMREASQRIRIDLELCDGRIALLDSDAFVEAVRVPNMLPNPGTPKKRSVIDLESHAIARIVAERIRSRDIGET